MDMTVLHRPDTPTHQLPGASFTSLATPAMGSVDTSVWEVRLSAEHPVGPGDVFVAPTATLFSIRASGDSDLVAICCLPVGGKAAFDGGEPFTPPWAE
jgi:hypothetical protein